MMLPIRGLPLTAIFLGFAILLSGCDSSEDEEIELIVFLINENPVNYIHILGPGESFSHDNRVEAGSSRKVELRVKSNEPQQFRAGRNGKVLDTANCTYTGRPATRALVDVIVQEDILYCTDDWDDWGDGSD